MGRAAAVVRGGAWRGGGVNGAKTFSNAGDFQACHTAEEWLRERGFSIGSSQGSEPRAIWHGDCCISKWRGLSAADKRDMHAKMTGDQRSGPVHIHLCPGASVDAIAAFNRADTATEELPGGQRYSTTVFKENGDPILLNAAGSRSIFCDVDE